MEPGKLVVVFVGFKIFDLLHLTLILICYAYRITLVYFKARINKQEKYEQRMILIVTRGPVNNKHMQYIHNLIYTI